VIAVNGWLQDGAALPYDLDRRSRDISLAEFTKKGIELLDNEKGFFLMVEGGKIDWACHANDGRTSIQDTLAFDRAVEAAYAFYENHPEETLIVVTGDHECGGMTIGFAGTRYDMNFDLMAGQKVSFQKFSAEIMGAFKKSENPSFAAVQPLIEENFGLVFEGDPKDLRTLKPHEKKKIRKAFQRSLAGDTVQSGNPETYLLYGGYDPLTVTLTHILNQKAGLGWTSYKHTGVPVSTSAVGAGAEAFSGAYDNTDIGLTIMAAMGFPAASNGSGSDPQTAALR
jgi:alkaline phosphatase